LAFPYSECYLHRVFKAMEQHAFKNVNKYLKNNIYSYLETSGG